jgi:hypothetical protein
MHTRSSTEEAVLLPDGQQPTNDFPVDHTQEANALPRSSFLYNLFVLVSGTAALFSILMMLGQFFMWMSLRDSFWTQKLLRAYVILFCTLFILAEMQFPLQTRLVPSLNNWLYRGLIYSFIGVIGLEESYATLAQEYPKSPDSGNVLISLLLKVASYGMFTLGLLYMLMGGLCLNRLCFQVRNRSRE